MRLLVVSHKVVWRSSAAPTGYATDGGFALQMAALAELFDSVTLAVPCRSHAGAAGEVPIAGRGIRVRPLTVPSGTGLRRKLALPGWLARNRAALMEEMISADAVHAPVPSDVATIGMLVAYWRGMPLFVRHCGRWDSPRTIAERLWRTFMEHAAGGRNVMLATGGGMTRPSSRSAEIEWTFATSMWRSDFATSGPRRAPAPGRLRLAIACRQEPRKGTTIVIAALPLIVKAVPDASLDVIGDGSEMPALRTQVQRLGLESRVTFHGRVHPSEVRQLLSTADLFCYPTSASEGFPKVVLEALACGVPVIATPVSVIPHLLEGGGGIVISQPVAEEVAAAAIAAIQAAPAYERMSEAAVRTALPYSLDSWRDSIGARLTAAWGPLRQHA